MNNKEKKRVRIIIISVLVIFIGLGFALLESPLDIIGNAGINKTTWDVHFDNANITDYSDSNMLSNVPSIKGEDKQEIEYEITFNKPGDYYEFTVDMVNSGNLDAELKSYTTKLQIDNGQEITLTEDNWNTYFPSYLDFSLTNTDGDLSYLEVGDSSTIKIRIGLNYNISTEEFLAIRGKKIVLKHIYEYKQGHGRS